MQREPLPDVLEVLKDVGINSESAQPRVRTGKVTDKVLVLKSSYDGWLYR